jgi:hypothetical protein
MPSRSGEPAIVEGDSHPLDEMIRRALTSVQAAVA